MADEKSESSKPDKTASTSTTAADAPPADHAKSVSEAEDACLAKHVTDEEPEEAPADEPKKTKEKPKPSPDEEDARAALRLAGWDDELLGAVSSEKLLALGKKAKEAQVKSATTWQELQELKKSQTPKAETPKPKEGAKAPAPDTKAGEAADIEGLDDAMSALRSVLAEDDAKVFDGAITKAVRAAHAKSAKEITALVDSIESLKNAMAELYFDTLRNGALSEWPGLSEKDKFDAIKTQTREKLKEDSDPHELFREVARSILGDPVVQDAARRQRNGQPDTGSRGARPKPVTEDQREDAVLAALERGASRETARRIYNSS